MDTLIQIVGDHPIWSIAMVLLGAGMLFVGALQALTEVVE
jgi:hypothetical protein